MCWMSPSQGTHELFRRDVRLPQYASQRANLDFGVHGNDAALGFPPHDDVTATLPDLRETEALECANHFRPGHTGQLRQARAQGW